MTSFTSRGPSPSVSSTGWGLRLTSKGDHHRDKGTSRRGSPLTIGETVTVVSTKREQQEYNPLFVASRNKHGARTVSTVYLSSG